MDIKQLDDAVGVSAQIAPSDVEAIASSKHPGPRRGLEGARGADAT